jgi:hypothetical protein
MAAMATVHDAVSRDLRGRGKRRIVAVAASREQARLTLEFLTRAARGKPRIDDASFADYGGRTSHGTSDRPIRQMLSSRRDGQGAPHFPMGSWRERLGSKARAA